jgi:hypothetical protein
VTLHVALDFSASANTASIPQCAGDPDFITITIDVVLFHEVTDIDALSFLSVWRTRSGITYYLNPQTDSVCLCEMPNAAEI